MPIDLISSIKTTSQWAFSSPVLNNILGSSLFVAFMIALIMILIVMVMYPAKSKTPFSSVVKIFTYMFFTSLLVIFLHDGVCRYLYEEETEDKARNELMQGVNSFGRDAVYGNTPLINPGISKSTNGQVVNGGQQVVNCQQVINDVQQIPNINNQPGNMQQAAPVSVLGGTNKPNCTYQDVPAGHYIDGGNETGILNGGRPPPRRVNIFAT